MITKLYRDNGYEYNIRDVQFNIEYLERYKVYIKENYEQKIYDILYLMLDVNKNRIYINNILDIIKNRYNNDNIILKYRNTDMFINHCNYILNEKEYYLIKSKDNYFHKIISNKKITNIITEFKSFLTNNNLDYKSYHDYKFTNNDKNIICLAYNIILLFEKYNENKDLNISWYYAIRIAASIINFPSNKDLDSIVIENTIHDYNDYKEYNRINNIVFNKFIGDILFINKLKLNLFFYTKKN
jgi:hypothetical protein